MSNQFPGTEVHYDTQYQLFKRQGYNYSTKRWEFIEWMPRGWAPPSLPAIPQLLQRQKTDSGDFNSTPWSASNTTQQSSSGYTNLPRGIGPTIEDKYPTNYTSHSEALDPSFHVRKKAFFIEGKVFAVIMNETAGGQAATYYNSALSDSSPNVNAVKYRDNLVYTQVRRFVVVRQKREFCFACPIFTYSGRGTLKRGVRPEEHGIAYSIGYTPQLLEGESGITKVSIGVKMVANVPALSKPSRIYYGLHHPVQYNVKVKDIGQVPSEHIPSLIANWKEEDDKDERLGYKVIDEESDTHTVMDNDTHLYHPKKNRYGYDAARAPNAYHPSHNPYGYHPENNIHGYHPDSNPWSYHPKHNPYGYHAQKAPFCYHPSFSPYGYHSEQNPHGYHPERNPYGYHPGHKPFGYHPTRNPHAYHPLYNPDGMIGAGDENDEMEMDSDKEDSSKEGKEGEGHENMDDQHRGSTSNIHEPKMELATNPRGFFKKGRVFMTRWVEPEGFSGKPFSEKARFAVIKPNPNFSICLRISTYSGQGTAKPSVSDRDHAAIVPVGGVFIPHPQGEHLDKAPIEVKIENPEFTIDPMSRINFTKPYSVEHNVKICNIGRVVSESLVPLERYFAESLGYIKPQ